MTIEFIQNGKKKVLKTPRKTTYSTVVIKNMKKAICIVVRKKSLREKKRIKLKSLGESLLADKITLNTYYKEKEKELVKSRRKKTFKIKILKDENSIVKIQKELFENITL